MYFFFFKQKTAYEMRISDWSSDVCSSDLSTRRSRRPRAARRNRGSDSCPPASWRAFPRNVARAARGWRRPTDRPRRSAKRPPLASEQLVQRLEACVREQLRAFGRPALHRIEIGRATGRERVGQDV